MEQVSQKGASKYLQPVPPSLNLMSKLNFTP